MTTKRFIVVKIFLVLIVLVNLIMTIVLTPLPAAIRLECEKKCEQNETSCDNLNDDISLSMTVIYVKNSVIVLLELFILFGIYRENWCILTFMSVFGMVSVVVAVCLITHELTLFNVFHLIRVCLLTNLTIMFACLNRYGEGGKDVFE